VQYGRKVSYSYLYCTVLCCRFGYRAMAGLGLFGQGSVIAVAMSTMPIATALKFKSCIRHRKMGSWI
jgi:hypothetical protein